MNFAPNRSPFLQILWRSVVWMPIMIVLSVILIAAAFSTIFMPVYGAILLWTGDYLQAALAFLSGFIGYLAARFLSKRMWEPPSSLL